MHMRLTGLGLLAVLTLTACQESVSPPSSSKQTPTPSFGKAPSGDPAIIAMMEAANKRLKDQGINVAIEAIQYFTIGKGRPSNRIHQQEFRWVPGDPRRLAQGDDITYMVAYTDVPSATSRGDTKSGLTPVQTKGAIRRSLATWTAHQAFQKVDLIERAYPGGDVTFFDALIDAEAPVTTFDDPGATNFFTADIINAGWLPREYFEKVGGPGGGRGILAFSVTFTFTDDDGNPTDINGDNRLDSALNEVYYNDTFGDPANDRVNNPWRLNQALPAIDVETVSLHENGHSLGVGHFGPPPAAVMNPVYAGIRQAPFSIDNASMRTVWASWPNP